MSGPQVGNIKSGFTWLAGSPVSTFFPCESRLSFPFQDFPGKVNPFLYKGKRCFFLTSRSRMFSYSETPPFSVSSENFSMTIPPRAGGLFSHRRPVSSDFSKGARRSPPHVRVSPGTVFDDRVSLSSFKVLVV